MIIVAVFWLLLGATFTLWGISFIGEGTRSFRFFLAGLITLSILGVFMVGAELADPAHGVSIWVR